MPITVLTKVVCWPSRYREYVTGDYVSAKPPLICDPTGQPAALNSERAVGSIVRVEHNDRGVLRAVQLLQPAYQNPFARRAFGYRSRRFSCGANTEIAGAYFSPPRLGRSYEARPAAGQSAPSPLECRVAGCSLYEKSNLLLKEPLGGTKRYEFADEPPAFFDAYLSKTPG
jgi:hypothetical protein